jgi:AcrR family transcriptional regulator
MTTDNGTSQDLERSVALLWGDQAPGRRGPRAKLTVEAIARAAIQVADAHGLEALSMQRVAAELGYTTMSIYNHIPSKELLLEVMVDAAADRPPEIDDTEDWRDGVTRWVKELWIALQAHPWVLRVPLNHAPIGPNQLTWLDRLLRHMLSAGLPESAAMSAAQHLLSAVRGMAQIDTDLTHAGGTARPTDTQIGQMLAGLIDPQRFPALTVVAAAESIAPQADTLPVHLQFSLDLFLDGIEAWTSNHAQRGH